MVNIKNAGITNITTDTETDFTDGSVIFAENDGTLQEDNTNLFYDKSLGYLGIGTNTPSYALDIVGIIQATSDIACGGDLYTTDIHCIALGLRSVDICDRSLIADDGTTEALVWADGNIETKNGRVVNTSRYTTTQTITVKDHIIFANTDGSAWTLTLPAGVEGQEFFITNCGSSGNALTLNGSGAETINGELTQTLNDDDSVHIVYNATEKWRVF